MAVFFGDPYDKISNRAEYVRYLIKCFNTYHQYFDDDEDEKIEANLNIFEDLRKFTDTISKDLCVKILS